MSRPRRASANVSLRESAVLTDVAEATKTPYGNVTYADPGYQSDGVKRYPIDTEAHVRAAWSYINQADNAAKYSAANLAKVKAKIKAAAKKLGITISEAEVPAVDDDPVLVEQALEGSWEDTTEDLRDLLRAAHPGSWIYVRGTYPDSIVYDAEPQTPATGQTTTTYERSWSVDDAGEITLGDPVQVQIVDTVKPVGESAASNAPHTYAEPEGDGVMCATCGRAQGNWRHTVGPDRRSHPRMPKPKVTQGTESEAPIGGEFIPLSERAVRKDGSISIKVIKPGWGASGYYSDALLRRDGPAVFGEGTKMYWDHPSKAEERDRPERSLRDLAAITTAPARWVEEGPNGPGLYADAKVVGAYREPLQELAEHIGVSIRAGGKFRSGEAEGRKGRIIEKIVPGGHSIDFVTTPGAGGKVLDLFEAARPPEGQEDDMEKLQEAEQKIATLEESERTLKSERDAALDRATRAETALNIRRARDVIREALRTQRLPEAVKTRLVEKLSTEPPLIADGEHAGELDRDKLVESIKTAATEEIKYLTEATGSNRIRGLGSGSSDDGPGGDVAEVDADLERELGRMGLSESAAKVATAGRG